MRRKWVLFGAAAAALAVVFLLGSALFLYYGRETPALKLARIERGMTPMEVDAIFARPADAIMPCPRTTGDGMRHQWEERVWSERGCWVHVYFDEDGVARDKDLEFPIPEPSLWERVWGRLGL
jgi:hypothetical protein